MLAPYTHPLQCVSGAVTCTARGGVRHRARGARSRTAQGVWHGRLPRDRRAPRLQDGARGVPRRRRA
eukprot:371407-Prymnesium_polylepis.1